MKTTKLWGMSLAVAAVLVQAGCSSKDSAPTAEAVAPETTNRARDEGHSAPRTAKPIAISVTLPEGTRIAVRTTSTLSTNTQQPGQTFTAQLEQPLVHEGREIAPRGAQVDGTIVDADKGGRVKDRASLAVRLTRLHMAGGQVLEVSTNTITRQARATKREDAAKIGIGSGIGAAIGAIAGGGKGAAIGAAAGAGGGTGVVLATRGDPAVIATETVLNFVLRSPVAMAELQ